MQFAVQFLFQYLSTTDVCWPAAVNALAAIAGSRGISALLEVSLCSRVLTVCVWAHMQGNRQSCLLTNASPFAFHSVVVCVAGVMVVGRVVRVLHCSRVLFLLSTTTPTPPFPFTPIAGG